MALSAALRPYITAGLALTTAGVIAVTPVPAVQAPSLTQPSISLTAGDSLLNVPLNLFQAILNIPANEIHAMSTLAQSLFYSGPWWVGSPTNVWGEDPGDLGHFESVIEMMVPFPELSGAGHEGDFAYDGLAQQLAMLAAVEIPADPSCESLDCLPAMPTSPITGFTWIDQAIWSLLIVTGLQKMPIIDNWFQIPFSAMTNGNSYYFDPATQAGLQDSGVGHDGFLWEGTRTAAQIMAAHPEMETEHPDAWAALEKMDPDTPMMPWTGTSYAMDFQQPFTNFFNSLMAPFDASKFEMPDPTEFLRVLQADLAAMIVAFNPFIPGSPFCPGECLLPEPGGNIFDAGDWNTPSYVLAVQAIDAMWPGNKIIDEWLTAHDAGTANVSTPEIIDYEGLLWRLGQTLLDLKNPLPPNPAIDTSDFLPTAAQIHDALGDYWYNIVDNSGILGPFDAQGLWDAIFNITPAA
ncbi:hypothetical protein KIH27_16795 [Mycobacterium sp. M1]|uniref:ABC transporter substrate-binding protein n=1 Tax=Mycolicibacter acidiphilus TaxID=2835306 RepID=A0ABS5RLQ5_9MYCO|nr:hypothetical protein [Mycolicibacter acidiphilus]MBS9535248.1 hypothetical protein [Mycolicibacter acidiphilus]